MRQIKILNILPNIDLEDSSEGRRDRAKLRDMLLEDTNGLVLLDSESVGKGNESIECFYDSAMVAPYVIQIAKKAELRGYDAVLLDCFMDPALGECRELLTIPCFGPCLSACSLASRMGGEFSIIGILSDMDRCIKENLRKYALRDQLMSIRIVDLPVLELCSDMENTIGKLIDEGERCVREDKAKVLVFGCTGLSPFVNAVKDGLVMRGIDVPVIEPMRAALYDAVSCVLQGITHSKVAYCQVRQKKRILDWE